MTHDDRWRVAEGLAAGLGYAEIARRLGRPTSTVSREVGRNGGRSRYQAASADAATRRRAWRRPRAPRAVPIDQSELGARDRGAVRAFIERFAAVMARTGIPRMTARILATLFAADAGSLTSAELVGVLRVSPASVSRGIAQLEALELVRRDRDPNDRRERYAVESDLWLRSWTASSRKHAVLADLAREGAQSLGVETSAGVRLGEMARFFEQLGEDMAGGDTLGSAAVDPRIVAAALVHCARPIGPERLARALGWTEDRLAAALAAAEKRPEWIAPAAIRPTPSGDLVAIGAEHLLAAPQRNALDGLAGGEEIDRVNAGKPGRHQGR